uniref:Uncharacterized protein n=1 Tax=Triticum urartu TaxID=4572 RepID=A0A8R7QZR6_TRIUA
MTPLRRGQPRLPPHASGFAPFGTATRAGQRGRCVEVDVAFLPTTSPTTLTTSAVSAPHYASTTWCSDLSWRKRDAGATSERIGDWF